MEKRGASVDLGRTGMGVSVGGDGGDGGKAAAHDSGHNSE